ncbi:MAG: hypothetical protein Q8912_15305 [Bacillota bacterium]|nr:hypothetical protein [Bacillota bacterium]
MNQEKELQELFNEYPEVDAYLKQNGYTLYHCERTNELRIRGEQGDDEFDLSLELFVSICKSESSKTR